MKDYRYEELSEEGWAQVVSTFRKLEFGKFDELNPGDMEKLLRENVSKAIEEHCEKKKKGGVGKKKIPNVYKRLFKKKKRISRRYNNLDLDLSIKERNDMKEKIRVIEQEIRREKQGKIDREEEEAWLKMRENQKTFYQYARKKKRVHPYIGPFCVKGVIIRKKACEVLNSSMRSGLLPRKRTMRSMMVISVMMKI